MGRSRVVISQLEGMGRGNLAAYNAEDIKLLHEMLETLPLKDGNEWLAQLMRTNKMLGTSACLLGCVVPFTRLSLLLLNILRG